MAGDSFFVAEAVRSPELSGGAPKAPPPNAPKPEPLGDEVCVVLGKDDPKRLLFGEKTNGSEAGGTGGIVATAVTVFGGPWKSSRRWQSLSETFQPINSASSSLIFTRRSTSSV